VSTDALYILVVLAFFVVLGVGVYAVNRIMDPGRAWPHTTQSRRRVSAPRPRSDQRPASASPVEKRKPTPGSVST
jgi:hypothetical protein